MTRYTNNQSIPLPLAVWLARDSYDYVSNPNYISATSLLRPVRQTVLCKRLSPDVGSDVADLTAARIGTAIHDSIEDAWVNHCNSAMLSLGYPENVVKRMLINPTEEELRDRPDGIPVYLERRSTRKLGKFIIGGKFDFVGEGRVHDFKTTSTFTFQNKTKNDDYIKQGSIYRWLNEDIITEDDMSILFVFTDFSKLRAMTDKDKGYPQGKLEELRLPLMSVRDTENFIRHKLDEIDKYMDTDEADIPLCSKKELWQGDTVYKYFKNPAGKRATKNFDNIREANQRLIADGNVGIVKEVPGEAKACNYCPAYDLCSQKDSLIASGILKMR